MAHYKLNIRTQGIRTTATMDRLVGDLLIATLNVADAESGRTPVWSERMPYSMSQLLTAWAQEAIDRQEQSGPWPDGPSDFLHRAALFAVTVRHADSSNPYFTEVERLEAARRRERERPAQASNDAGAPGRGPDHDL